MTTNFKDYYAVLGVEKTATAEEIKKAFRKLARKHHPDTAADKKGAEEKFKEINEAYEVLGDPEKRRKYDSLGASWDGGVDFQGHPGWQTGWSDAGGAAREFHFGGTGFSDFFERYFGGGHRGGSPWEAEASGGPRRRQARGDDIEGDILVSLEEAMHGTIRTITLQTRNRKNGRLESREFQVRIPPGAANGSRIRVPGEGEPGSGGGGAGDLYLRVRHAAHPDFSTSGADVYHELEIAPWEAVLGAEVSVPALDGAIRLRVPAGAENGQSLRVRGRGLPMGKSAAPGSRGDYFVTLRVVTPSTVTDEERRAWENLRDISKFRPRGRESGKG